MEDYIECKRLREIGDHQSAWKHYLLALPILRDTSERTLLLYEASILLFYVSDEKREGLEASYEVLKTTHVDDSIYNCVHENLMFYTKNIKGVDLDFKPKKHEDTDFFYTTPTFVDDENVIYRLVNYEITDVGSYVVHDEKQVVRTENLWEGKGLLQTCLKENLGSIPFQENMPVQGLEDLRVTRASGKVYALAASWEYSNFPNTVSQVLLEIDEISLSTHVLSVLNNGPRCEKNWVWCGQFPYLVYDWYPYMTILKIDENKVVPHLRVNSHPLLRHMRGSSSGINFKKEIWFVTHSVVVSRGPIRHYLHYLVVLAEDLRKVTKVSFPFTFEENADIEFCTSIRVGDGGIQFAYSRRDANPKIKFVPWCNIEKLMINV
jgi:hypothetical protein